MGENEQVEGKESSPEVVSISPKVRPTKETWLKARVDYETGNYDSVKDLAAKYGIDYKKLRDKAYEDDWLEFKVTTSGKIRQKIEEKAVSKVEKFFAALEEKGNYYEKLVKASQAQASCNSEGIPQLDPSDLETYSKVEGRAIDWKKTAYGISDKSSVDVTSGGKTMEENIVSALHKIRALASSGAVIEVEPLRLAADKLRT